MYWLRLVYTRLYGLPRKERIEQDMEEEMHFHLRMRTRENIERGMSPDEAERDARRRFGNMGRNKDMGRDIKRTLYQGGPTDSDQSPPAGSVAWRPAAVSAVSLRDPAV